MLWCLQYEECIVDCELVVEIGRLVYVDFKLILKVFIRKGIVLMKMVKIFKDYEVVIEVFNKVLIEYCNLDILKKLNDVECVKKEIEQ